eukprot:scaffold182866_cov33-Tisochrysis_lutea.AAC.3
MGRRCSWKGKYRCVPTIISRIANLPFCRICATALYAKGSVEEGVREGSLLRLLSRGAQRPGGLDDSIAVRAYCLQNRT